jgi:hypothetical protein
MFKLIKEDRIFTDFKEGKIAFNPTYRRLKKEKEYSNKKD